MIAGIVFYVVIGVLGLLATLILFAFIATVVALLGGMAR